MSAQTLAIICGIAGILGLVAGAGLLIAPTRTRQERTQLWFWLFEIDLFAVLDRRRTIERPLYRHHYAFGATVVVAALAWLATLWGLLDHPLAVSALSGMLGSTGAEAVIVTSWALVVLVFGMGVFLFVRPSALKNLESAANRWIEPFPLSLEHRVPAEKGISRLILRAPRFTGLLLMAAGLGCLLALALPAPF